MRSRFKDDRESLLVQGSVNVHSDKSTSHITQSVGGGNRQPIKLIIKLGSTVTLSAVDLHQARSCLNGGLKLALRLLSNLMTFLFVISLCDRSSDIEYLLIRHLSDLQGIEADSFK